MKMEELKETLALLKQANVDAKLCDCPVRVSGTSVPCGNPTEPDDMDYSDYILLPKELVGMYPEIFISADGDSMIGAGYESGDNLRIRLGALAHDAENVLAMIEGRCTIKTFFTDEENEKWLVPQNDAYDAIKLTDEMDARILGVVVGVEKASTRASSRLLLQAIRRTKNKLKAASNLTDAEVDERIARMGDFVVHARQWYAVYRALLDKNLTHEDDFSGFCERVKRLLPEHLHLPEPKELSRMAVQSFAKPIPLWAESNAPVSGSRFRDYLRIGMTMGEFLAA